MRVREGEISSSLNNTRGRRMTLYMRWWDVNKSITLCPCLIKYNRCGVSSVKENTFSCEVIKLKRMLGRVSVKRRKPNMMEYHKRGRPKNRC